MARTDLTRRTLLTSGAALAAVGALAGVAVADEAPKASDAPVAGTRYTTYANPDEIGIVHDADSEEDAAVVYVGTGIGGMMGAMICAEQMPEAKVLLVEKNDFCGGNTNYAERNAPKAGTERAQALAEGHETAKNSTYMKDGRLYAERAIDYGKNSGWMYLKHGLQLRVSNGFTPMYEGGNGAASIERLRQEILNDEAYKNLELRMNTRATALLLDDEHTCTGVQLLNADGTYTNVNANAVVLATGGMSTNLDLLQYYSGQDLSKCDFMGVGQDGDGHLMVEQTAHGRCKTIALSSMYTHVNGLPINSLLSVAVSMNNTTVFVNQDGERFADESCASDVARSKIIESQGKVYGVIGTGLLNWLQDGNMAHMKGLVGESYGNEPWDASEDLAASENLPEGTFFKGETIEELAQNMGVDVDAFTAAIDQYEADVEAGQGDTAYGKPAEAMVSLGEGPYYAFKLTSTIFNTNNGIRVNGNAQVVDPEYVPVKGLYAAGICMSGFNDAEVYSVATSQSSSVWAGSKAARHLIENCCGGTVAEDWFGPEEYTADSVVAYEDFTL